MNTSTKQSTPDFLAFGFASRKKAASREGRGFVYLGRVVRDLAMFV
jgi:hypothetical protein